MNQQVDDVLASISKWNTLKKDKEEVFSLWKKCSSFKVILPLESDCKENFHIYFGVQVDKKTLSNALVMHVISDYNDQPERIKNFKNADDYIYSVVLDNFLTESAEIDEVEAKKRASAWQNQKILKEYLEKNDAFDVFTLSKNDFLIGCDYKAYFGMKFNKELLTADLIIQNNRAEITTTYYDLARICPPYGTGSIFGLQDLSS